MAKEFQLSMEAPTRAKFLSALADMMAPAVWVPGAIAIVLLALLAQNVVFCAIAVFVTLYVTRLWSRLSKQEGRRTEAS